MTVSQEGLVFRIRKGLVMKKETVLVAPWDAIRELKNRLLQKHSFDLTFPHSDRDLSLRVMVRSAQYIKLSGVLEALPSAARAPMCVICGGPVVDGLCKSCGGSVSAWARKRIVRGGLLTLAFIGWGIALLVTDKAHIRALGFLFVFGPLVGIWMVLHALHRIRVVRKAAQEH